MWRILFWFRQEGWHFRRQVQIGPYYADFACHHAHLAVEIDGDTHGTVEQIAHDATRTAYLRGRGYDVVRFSNHELMSNPDGVYTVLQAELADRPHTPTPVPSPQGGGRPSRKPRQPRRRIVEDSE